MSCLSSMSAHRYSASTRRLGAGSCASDTYEGRRPANSWRFSFVGPDPYTEGAAVSMVL